MAGNFTFCSSVHHFHVVHFSQPDNSETPWIALYYSLCRRKWTYRRI